MQYSRSAAHKFGLTSGFPVCGSKKLLKTVTVDVTGTVMRYKMHLGDIYCSSATRVGLPCPDYERILKGYKAAYKTMKRDFPCFGAAMEPQLETREWWRRCVHLSFKEAGYDFGDLHGELYTKMFNRIYALFGSKEPYEVFADVHPFFDWMSATDVRLGVVTNSDERYRTTILPLLDLDHYFSFIVTCKDSRSKKPNHDMFEYAAETHGFELDETWLHIGDSIGNDYTPVYELGGEAILVDRFKESYLQSALRQGITVCDNFTQLRAIIEDRYEFEPRQSVGQHSTVSV